MFHVKRTSRAVNQRPVRPPALGHVRPSWQSDMFHVKPREKTSVHQEPQHAPTDPRPVAHRGPLGRRGGSTDRSSGTSLFPTVAPRARSRRRPPRRSGPALGAELIGHKLASRWAHVLAATAPRRPSGGAPRGSAAAPALPGPLPPQAWSPSSPSSASDGRVALGPRSDLAPMAIRRSLSVDRGSWLGPHQSGPPRAPAGNDGSPGANASWRPSDSTS